MSFKIQQAGTSLFWTVDSENKIRLRPEGSVYEKDDAGHIRNVNTGMYIRHYAYVLFESELGSPDYDFEWTIETTGAIRNEFDGGCYVNSVGDELKIEKVGLLWVNVPEVPAEVAAPEVAPEVAAPEVAPEVAAPEVAAPEVAAPEVAAPEEDDVPVSRASALIEEALNAKAASPGCGCECGCGPDCQGCECECGCPKAAPVA
jgi:hypothetical protein